MLVEGRPHPVNLLPSQRLWEAARAEGCRTVRPVRRGPEGPGWDQHGLGAPSQLRPTPSQPAAWWRARPESRLHCFPAERVCGQAVGSLCACVLS